MIRAKWTLPLTAKLIGILLWFAIICIFPSCMGQSLRNSDRLDPELSTLIQTSPPKDSYPDADLIHLLDECVVEVSRDGSAKEVIHRVFKIVSEYGKEFANCSVGYNSRTDKISLLYARTITPDGEIIPLKKNATKVVTPYTDFPDYSDYKELTFSLPGVEVGSVIDYKYVREIRPTIPGEFNDRFFFQTDDPILISRYKLFVPETMEIEYLLLNPLEETPQPPITSLEGNRKVYLWEQRNVSQILDEENMPPYAELAPNILVTTSDTWDPFFRWWGNEVKGKTDADRAIKEKVADLVGDLSDRKEKVEALFDYVKRDIRYVSIDMGKSGYVPASAKEVFANKYGDCKDQSTLLISMLREAGIPAHHVLIPTHGMGDLITDFALPFQFNHCIVAVENGNSYHYLDPTAEDYDYEYLPEGDQNRGVLVFRPNKPVFARTPLEEGKKNAGISYHRVKIGKDGSIEAEIEQHWSGSKEAELRGCYIEYTPTELGEMLEKYVYETFSGAKLLSYTNSDPLNFKKRLETSLKYQSIGYCKKSGDILIFRLPGVDATCSGAEKEDRRYPISYWSRNYIRDEVEFNIPEGYDVVHLPEAVNIVSPYFEFRSRYQIEGKRVVYHEEFAQKAVHISPDRYRDYRTFCQRIDQSASRYILFKKIRR